MNVINLRWTICFGLLLVLLMKLCHAQNPMFNQRTRFGGFGQPGRAGIRQGQQIPRQIPARGPRMSSDVMFGSQFRGRGPGSVMARGMQFGGAFPDRTHRRTGQFGFRDQNQRGFPSRQGQLAPQRRLPFQVPAQRFQPNDVTLQEARQPFNTHSRINRVQMRSHGWGQPASGSRGSMQVSPETVRQGFVSRFTGQRQQVRQRQSQIQATNFNNLQAKTKHSVTANIQTRRNVPVATNPSVRIATRFTNRPGRQMTDLRSAVIGQARQHSRQHIRPKAAQTVQGQRGIQHGQAIPVVKRVEKQSIVQSPDTAGRLSKIQAQPNHQVISNVQRQASVLKTVFPRPNTPLPLVVVRKPVAASDPQQASGLATSTKVVQSHLKVEPKIVPSFPQVLPPNAAGSGSVAELPTIADQGPTLEEDLQLIQSVAALLQAAGSPIQIPIPNIPKTAVAATATQRLGHPPLSPGVFQFGHPGMLSPWGAPLGSAQLQELMFGDTTDPPDIVATTTVTPNVSAGNISEPVLNISVVTAAVKTPALEQIPAPQGEGTTPTPEIVVATEQVPTEGQNQGSEMLTADKAIRAEVTIDAKGSENPPTLKLEPLPDVPHKAADQGTQSTDVATKEAVSLNVEGINLVTIISDALKSVSYPESLQRKLLKQLSRIMTPTNITTVSKEVTNTKSVDAESPSKSVQNTEQKIQSPETTPASAQIDKVTTEIPIKVDIVTDRLPTAADLGVVIKDLPEIETTTLPTVVTAQTISADVINESTILDVVNDSSFKNITDTLTKDDETKSNSTLIENKVDIKPTAVDGSHQEKVVTVVINDPNNKKEVAASIVPSTDKTDPIYTVDPALAKETPVIKNNLISENAIIEENLNLNSVKLETTYAGKPTESKLQEITASKSAMNKNIGKVADAIAMSNGKPALEIVLESLAAPGVEFLSRAVPSVDPSVINKLTAVPKLSGVDAPNVRKELIEPAALAEHVQKEISSPTKVPENKTDIAQAGSHLSIATNISKDSVLRQIDLASLAKELKLISNGTDITDYLADPLFVSVLEDIVNQTLSTVGKSKNTKEKKQNIEPEMMTTETPIVTSTGDYEPPEIELEDITTTAAPISTQRMKTKRKKSKG